MLQNDQPHTYFIKSLIQSCKPYLLRVQLNISLSPPFKLRCMFSFGSNEIIALFFPTGGKFQIFQVEMQTDGLARCPSSSVSCYASSFLRVRFRPVQRDQASQVALSFQLNQGHKPFCDSLRSRLHFTLLPGFTSFSKTNLHLEVCYPEQSHQGQSIRQMAVWPWEIRVQLEREKKQTNEDENATGRNWLLNVCVVPCTMGP